MLQNMQQHHPRTAVADVFSSRICVRQITPLEAIVISWVDVMKESSSMPGGWFEQKMSLLKQRFEVMLLTMDSVK
jgi:hypothetical protein